MIDDEIKNFQHSNIWKGGYLTGYSPKRNQKGVEKYIKENMQGDCCLEIGCGKGQWSKFIYDLNIFKKIYCIDVFSANHNKFWEYVGNDKKDKIEYIQVNDFSLECVPNNILDYVFSYDVFCHISYSGHQKYLKNLYQKCKNNCILNIMYADARKYLHSEPENLSHIKSNILKKGETYNSSEELIDRCLKDKDGSISLPRWFWVGVDNFIDICSENNYKILFKDLNIDKTNPITLFTKK